MAREDKYHPRGKFLNGKIHNFKYYLSWVHTTVHKIGTLHYALSLGFLYPIKSLVKAYLSITVFGTVQDM